jgi:hypothetical protein
VAAGSGGPTTTSDGHHRVAAGSIDRSPTTVAQAACRLGERYWPGRVPRQRPERLVQGPTGGQPDGCRPEAGEQQPERRVRPE